MNGKNAVFTTIGASSHSRYERESNDFYVTDPSAIYILNKHGLLDDSKYWECACGDGTLSEALKSLGYDVYSSDYFDRGYGDTGIDFLEQVNKFDGNIITNPPYSLINKFITKGLQLTENKLYIFARIQTLETKGRYESIFKNNPPAYVCPFVKRIECYRGGNKSKYSSAVCYAWFIWDNTIDNEDTLVKWLI